VGRISGKPTELHSTGETCNIINSSMSVALSSHPIPLKRKALAASPETKESLGPQNSLAGAELKPFLI